MTQEQNKMREWYEAWKKEVSHKLDGCCDATAWWVLQAYEHAQKTAGLEDCVIVLEDGAEPMEGDLVLASYNEDVFVYRVVDGKQDSGHYSVGGFECYGWPIKYEGRQIHKIIQRNGKPVIYRSALKPASTGNQE